MDWTRFNAATRYEVWHQLLGHVPFRNIEQTIQHSIGLEGPIGKRDPKDHKFPSCMIGKSTLENYPGSKEPDPGQWHWCIWMFFRHQWLQLKGIITPWLLLTAAPNIAGSIEWRPRTKSWRCQRGGWSKRLTSRRIILFWLWFVIMGVKTSPRSWMITSPSVVSRSISARLQVTSNGRTG